MLQYEHVFAIEFPFSFAQWSIINGGELLKVASNESAYCGHKDCKIINGNLWDFSSIAQTLCWISRYLHKIIQVNMLSILVVDWIVGNAYVLLTERLGHVPYANLAISVAILNTIFFFGLVWTSKFMSLQMRWLVVVWSHLFVHTRRKQ